MRKKSKVQRLCFFAMSNESGTVYAKNIYQKCQQFTACGWTWNRLLKQGQSHIFHLFLLLKSLMFTFYWVNVCTMYISTRVFVRTQKYFILLINLSNGNMYAFPIYRLFIDYITLLSFNIWMIVFSRSCLIQKLSA